MTMTSRWWSSNKTVCRARAALKMIPQRAVTSFLPLIFANLNFTLDAISVRNAGFQIQHVGVLTIRSGGALMFVAQTKISYSTRHGIRYESFYINVYKLTDIIKTNVGQMNSEPSAKSNNITLVITIKLYISAKSLRLYKNRYYLEKKKKIDSSSPLSVDYISRLSYQLAHFLICIQLTIDGGMEKNQSINHTYTRTHRHTHARGMNVRSARGKKALFERESRSLKEDVWD